MKYIKDMVKYIAEYTADKFIVDKLKYTLTVIITVLIFVLSVFMINEKSNLLLYLDFPSLLSVGILPFFIMCVMFGFSKTKMIFTLPFVKHKPVHLLNESLLFFKTFNQLIWLAALLVIIINSIEILMALRRASSLEMDYKGLLAITLISPLYAVLISLTVIIPYNTIIRKHMNTKDSEKETN
jgi:hypothetical protein